LDIVVSCICVPEFIDSGIFALAPIFYITDEILWNMSLGILLKIPLVVNADARIQNLIHNWECLLGDNDPTTYVHTNLKK
jgi:hypothetical protein